MILSAQENQHPSPVALSGGVIISLITPRHVSPTVAGDIVSEQVQRLHHIEGVTGFLIKAREPNGVRLNNQDVSFLLRAVKEKLARGKLLIADLGFLTSDTAQNAAGWTHAGANALMTTLNIQAVETADISQIAGIVEQTHLLERMRLPVILNETRREFRRFDAYKRNLQHAVAKADNVVGVFFGYDDRTSAYDENYYAIKAMDRPVACFTGSETALFHNLNTGADGVVSKLAFIAPHEVVALFRASRSARFFDAQVMHNKLSPLVELVGNRPPPEREAVFYAIAKRRGLLGSTEPDGEDLQLDPATIRRIDETLEAVALIPID
ncbi:dihydrodipicolinate synthase family protein [Litoreibacter roseus]|uniref:Dihydrodipicolinate synthase family protein n=1 Tax=Litoreibacter roseus TaxID=2601869 RepID=A0A6N6JNB9_9RHOB|nr:dihydrodipicolinate synthase family protein [Litoreibacter roseus]GFE67039.1 hypothetical protein KIN_41130 [Litoreibacter roseus]